MTAGPADFICANTAVGAPPLAPEIRLYLASEITPIWRASEESLARDGLPPPFWAFCWPGGQALARHILDNPEIVSGKRVLDFAAGGGVAAIAAVTSGAKSVAASEIDPFACAAMAMNAALNNVEFDILERDLTGEENAEDGGGWDVVLAGDVCYERPMSDEVMDYLRAAAKLGAQVLMADPGRNFLPEMGLAERARYDVPTSTELEDSDVRETVIWRVEA